VGTLNYAGQAPDSVLGIAGMFPSGTRIVLSLEKKDRAGEYPSDWILLQEPVKGIHSLIYYSCGLVSSGDSMAREAALLGVPSYYLGIRYDMPANLAAARVANLQSRKTAEIGAWLAAVTSPDARDSVSERQSALRSALSNNFLDINSYMMGLVK